MAQLLVSADDRTGALESAALCADAGWPTSVVPWDGLALPVTDPDGCTVVDLGSRHLAADEAARRAAALGAMPALRVHKIDSTLRGNWAAELAAIVAARRRVLLVPAFPAAGRTCRRGVVLEHGVPVGETAHARDPRAPVTGSRPALVLDRCDELRGPSAVRSWLLGDGEIAVADASSAGAIRRIVELVADRDVVVAGPAAVAGAVAARDADRSGVAARPISRTIERPLLVVCGSAHPVSRAQIDALEARTRCPVVALGDDVAPLAGVPLGALVAAPRVGDPAAHVTRLAATARELVAAGGFATVLLVGGDTAEAFLGAASVQVTGSLGVGIAAGRVHLDGHDLAVVAKPGAFGRPGTLVGLIRRGAAA